MTLKLQAEITKAELIQLLEVALRASKQYKWPISTKQLKRWRSLLRILTKYSVVDVVAEPCEAKREAQD